uniref:Band 7 domain-containing protein n=1 Tax=uncultured Chloroflexota bacterium TaxID=166587 RepID=H5SLB1_9CHLR|nr:hypothetical protein HGMM_F45G04C20 [uncultured Chloroflexota bacterium]
MNEPQRSAHNALRNWLLLGLLLYLLALIFLREYLNVISILLDLTLLLLLYIGWVFFFSQFLLPVQGVSNRLQIFSRLLSFWSRGPVIFVENGIPRERAGEEQRRGPGVLWLDSASGGVIRNQLAFVRPIGPGVHFTKAGEYPAGFVDLHAQIHTIGPSAREDPFKLADEAIQKKRQITSAYTRDGLEVVPMITVVFKIDAEPARGNRPGSRFGYHPESVLRAIRGEGIEVQVRGEGPRRVRWNQLPALLAADLWREYLGKFTLDECFQMREWELPLPPSPPPPRLDQTTRYYRPIQVHLPRRGLSGAFAEVLHLINRTLENALAAYLETYRPPASEDTVAVPQPSAAIQRFHETALQMIRRMILWRLQFPKVPELDNHGRYTGRLQSSPEFLLLHERGLRVRAVNIGYLHFPENIRQGLIQSWSANWLQRAKAERQQVEHQRAIRQVQGQEKALLEYSLRLSRDLERLKETNKLIRADDLLRCLLHRSRRELQREIALQQRTASEIAQMDEILQWLESNP